MQLIINGSTRTFPDAPETVQQLLNILQLQDKMVIVEHNEQILQKQDHGHAQLEAGDKLEIVHFVGGG
ncbi:sulfur carrier protein ThiS [Paenibacillus sp. WLX1005]|uniref:sulfur carrier protein ThiS n=1 Tax=Paenibacillus sp. WLX1005 TaxID=3243766 RepID=UPI003983E927